MKTVRNLLIAAAAMLAAHSGTPESSAQCFSGYDYYAPKPAVARFHHFQLDGRAFAFDRITGDIFCGNVKIGFRTPDGRVSLLPDAAARVAGVAPAGGVVAGQPAPAGQPAVGVAGGAPVAGAPAGGAAAPAVGAPAAGAAATDAPATPAPAAAPANGDAVPAAPAPTAAPAANSGAIPVLGSGNDPALPAAAAIDPELLSGQWRAESKDILDRTVIRELTFDEEKKLTFRVQVQGDEPRVIEGAFEIKEGKLTVTEDEEKRELGQISAENGQLIIKGENESLTFKRIEE
jgi:hypothetical protein